MPSFQAYFSALALSPPFNECSGEIVSECKNVSNYKWENVQISTESQPQAPEGVPIQGTHGLAHNSLTKGCRYFCLTSQGALGNSINQFYSSLARQPANKFSKIEGNGIIPNSTQGIIYELYIICYLVIKITQIQPHSVTRGYLGVPVTINTLLCNWTQSTVDGQ